jgi:hypothetical protein
MKSNTNCKKELNLNTEQHSKLIKGVVENALTSIRVSEIVELKDLCQKDRNTYCNKLKLRYIVFLGLLGLNYNITEEVEEYVFFFLHDLIHQITVSDDDDDTELSVQIS